MLSSGTKATSPTLVHDSWLSALDRDLLENQTIERCPRLAVSPSIAMNPWPDLLEAIMLDSGFFWGLAVYPVSQKV